MAGIHCSRCSSLINADTSSSSAPPWCPTCGADFKPAAKDAPPSAPAAVAVAPSAGNAPVAVVAVAPPVSRRLAHAPPSRPPRPKAPLPVGAPAEVAALGLPDQVHAPDMGQALQNRVLLRGLIGGLGLVMLALAGRLWWAADSPSPLLPPPDVALGLALAFAVLGLLLTVLAVAPRRRARHTYLVYEEVLVELSSGRHRIIPWEKVGSQRQTSPLLVSYCFPVQDGKAIRFDNTVRGHKSLCATIRDRAAERRSRVAFGGEAALAEMAAARPGPFLLAQQVAGDRGVFRITFLGDRLLFYKMAYGAGVTAGPPADQAGGLQSWAQAELHQKFLDEMRVLDEADAPTLLYLAAENEESFAASPADVRELHIDPPSTKTHFLQGISDVPHEGLLKLVHARRGALTLALLDREHVLLATQELPRLFGAVVKNNVVWSHSACHFVGKE